MNEAKWFETQLLNAKQQTIQVEEERDLLLEEVKEMQILLREQKGLEKFESYRKFKLKCVIVIMNEELIKWIRLLRTSNNIAFAFPKHK